VRTYSLRRRVRHPVTLVSKLFGIVRLVKPSVRSGRHIPMSSNNATIGIHVSDRPSLTVAAHE
jgi:hypothetical protein